MKLLPLLLALLMSSAFAQTATYSTSFTSACRARSFTDVGGNCIITNNDGSDTWFVWGATSSWVDFYEGTCVGNQYVTHKFTTATFDVVCDDGITKTEVQGTFVNTNHCRYGICIVDVAGTSSITATPEELHALGVPGY